jgi:hypothetical protein
MKCGTGLLQKRFANSLKEVGDLENEDRESRIKWSLGSGRPERLLPSQKSLL